MFVNHSNINCPMGLDEIWHTLTPKILLISEDYVSRGCEYTKGCVYTKVSVLIVLSSYKYIEFIIFFN